MGGERLTDSMLTRCREWSGCGEMRAIVVSLGCYKDLVWLERHNARIAAWFVKSIANLNLCLRKALIFQAAGGEDPNAMESCCDEERFCQDWGGRHKNLSCDLRYVTKGWRSGGA